MWEFTDHFGASLGPQPSKNKHPLEKEHLLPATAIASWPEGLPDHEALGPAKDGTNY